jgi:hypothetical protein
MTSLNGRRIFYSKKLTQTLPDYSFLRTEYLNRCLRSVRQQSTACFGAFAIPLTWDSLRPRIGTSLMVHLTRNSSGPQKPLTSGVQYTIRWFKLHHTGGSSSFSRHVKLCPGGQGHWCIGRCSQTSSWRLHCSEYASSFYFLNLVRFLLGVVIPSGLGFRRLCSLHHLHG